MVFVRSTTDGFPFANFIQFVANNKTDIVTFSLNLRPQYCFFSFVSKDVSQYYKIKQRQIVM